MLPSQQSSNRLLSEAMRNVSAVMGEEAGEENFLVASSGKTPLVLHKGLRGESGWVRIFLV